MNRLATSGSEPRHAATEWLCELGTLLNTAQRAATLQSIRLRQLAQHLEASADPRAGALLAGLDENGRVLGDSVERTLSLLRSRHHPCHTLQDDADSAAQPLASVLAGALRLPLARHGELDIDCSLDVEPDLLAPGPVVVWSQLLAELVANSVLHGFQGRRGGRIRVSAQRKGAAVLRVVYQDDGIGFSAQAREQAFRRRFSSLAAQGCSGLGLCMLRDIVQGQLNGAIALLETGSGAAFAIDVAAVGS